MKKLIAMLSITALVFINHIYPMTAVVTKLDRVSDTVIIENFNGMEYTFSPIEDWFEGDIATCIMFDNFTEDTIRDDVIFRVKYDGYLPLV